MRFSVTAAAAIVALAGCGRSGPQSDPAEEGRLQLVVSETPIALKAGERLALQLLVIGPGSGEAEISSPDLPPFATLQGSLLTLAPGRQYQGDYRLTLNAGTGSDTATATLHVVVARPNSAPTPGATYLWGTGGDPGGSFCSVFVNCTISGIPILAFSGTGDADGDPVTLDVEIVPEGQAFSGSPTQSVSSPVGVDLAPDCHAAHDQFHTCLEVRMPGLTAGQSYAFAVRMRDALGAHASWGPRTDPVTGWVTFPSWRFVQGAP